MRPIGLQHLQIASEHASLGRFRHHLPDIREQHVASKPIDRDWRGIRVEGLGEAGKKEAEVGDFPVVGELDRVVGQQGGVGLALQLGEFGLGRQQEVGLGQVQVEERLA